MRLILCLFSIASAGAQVVYADHWVKQEVDLEQDRIGVEEALSSDQKLTEGTLESEKRFAAELRTVCVDSKSPRLDYDVARIMEVLTEKLGPNGELWYEPSEITSVWVKRCILEGGIFIYCVDQHDHVVGCIAGSPLTHSVYAFSCNIAGRLFRSRPGFEVTHMVVLSKGGGAYSGLAGFMSHHLVQRVSDCLIIFDCTYDLNKKHGGGAWKVPHRSRDFVLAGCCYRYTGVVADPARPSWRHNNHLVVFYCDQAQGVRARL
jgi:hypothetical protein